MPVANRWVLNFIYVHRYNYDSMIIVDSQLVSLGSFRTLQHQVRGDVYAVDQKTIRIENFRYDGTGIRKSTSHR